MTSKSRIKQGVDLLLKNKSKYFSIALKVVKIVIISYVVLYSLRFIQLNFTGYKSIKANSLPYCLVEGTEELLYNKNVLDETFVSVQYVDLDGNFRKEFTLQWPMYGSRDIYLVDKDNSYKCIGSFRSWDDINFYLPRWTIFGFPYIYEDNGKILKWLGKEYEKSKYI
jgi:hypothetical protein